MEHGQLASGITKPLIFPHPEKMEILKGAFSLDEQTVIMLPENPSQNDVFLARFLAADLTDHYQLAVKTVNSSQVDEKRKAILMGTISNPLIESLCSQHGLTVSEQPSGQEGYILYVTDSLALIAGADEPGSFYGLQSLRQLTG